jgi:adenosylcobinamide-GDP ribazoletransferase
MAERLSTASVAVAVVVTACVSRIAALLLFGLTTPARAAGAAYLVGQPSRRTLATACVLVVGIAVGLGVAGGLPLPGLVLGLAVAVAVALTGARTASRLVGGHTGDIAGATQQIAEIGFLISLLIASTASTK